MTCVLLEKYINFQVSPEASASSYNSQPHQGPMSTPRSPPSECGSGVRTSGECNPNTVHILPETLVSGAVHVASSAINTARSVINMLVPPRQEVSLKVVVTNKGDSFLAHFFPGTHACSAFENLAANKTKSLQMIIFIVIFSFIITYSPLTFIYITNNFYH